jgi:hypothetical protein
MTEPAYLWARFIEWLFTTGIEGEPETVIGELEHGGETR